MELDHAALETLVAIGGAEFAASMIEMFDEVAIANLDAIRAAAPVLDVRAARRACHSLRSSAAQLGATALASALARGETETPTSSEELLALAAELDALRASAMVALRGWASGR
jgi:HPt (histidine-containing phosphotransfer) domain-containing protein